MKVRSDQLAAFRQAALRQFETDMVEHLRHFSPKRSELMGESTLREVIRFGSAQASKHGFTNRGPVRLYIELIFILGAAFDTDPQLPWAEEVLQDSRFPDQMLRARHLHERALAYIERVTGPDYELSRRALSQMIQERAVASRVSACSFNEDVLRHLESIHPQKCEHLGRSILQRVYRKAEEMAKQYGVESYPGIALFAGLIFVFGHGFAQDPGFPWMAALLASRSTLEPEAWLDEFYSLATAYLTGIKGINRR